MLLCEWGALQTRSASREVPALVLRADPDGGAESPQVAIAEAHGAGWAVALAAA